MLDLRQQRLDPLPQTVLDLPRPSPALLRLGCPTPPAASTKADKGAFPQVRNTTF
ncbi:hypothetical protein ABIA31_009482, partial [Catenulispora sp. MAP5-51]